MPMVPTPRTIADVGAAWLTGALADRAPGTEVDAVVHTEVVHGSLTKVALAVRYRENPHRLPEALYLKAAMEDHGIPVSMRPEALFYEVARPQIEVEAPCCHYAGHDETDGVIVLEDLRARGATMAGEYWQTCLDGPAGALVPAPYRDREQMAAWTGELWALDTQRPRCFCHGDAHLGNTYLDATGRPGFLDWGGVKAGHWAREVSYFVVGALGVEDRRAHEEDLLRGYLLARRHRANVERFAAAATDHRADTLFSD